MARLAKTFEFYVEPEPNSGCLLWVGGQNPDGYGIYWDPERQERRSAHIVAYERKHGPVPDGMELDHKCRVRRCVNAGHVEPVTHEENMRRSHRTLAACGHILSTIHGERRCRECRRFYLNAYMRRYRLHASQ